jgi:hypothetical protein
VQRVGSSRQWWLRAHFDCSAGSAMRRVAERACRSDGAERRSSEGAGAEGRSSGNNAAAAAGEQGGLAGEAGLSHARGGEGGAAGSDRGDGVGREVREPTMWLMCM